MAKKIKEKKQPMEKLFLIEGWLSDLIKSGSRRFVLDQTGDEQIETIDVEKMDIEIMLKELHDYIKLS